MSVKVRGWLCEQTGIVKVGWQAWPCAPELGNHEHVELVSRSEQRRADFEESAHELEEYFSGYAEGMSEDEMKLGADGFKRIGARLAAKLRAMGEKDAD